MLRSAMEQACGGSDAGGAWDWKSAYDACEAAAVLFLRRFGGAMGARAGSPAALLAMLAKVARPAPEPHAALGGERDLPAVLHAAPAGVRGGHCGRDYAGRPRAGAVGRHRPARHLRRACRRLARPERARRDARRPPRPSLPGCRRHPLRRGPDRRPPRCRRRPHRRSDEPAVLGARQCRPAPDGRGAAARVVRAGAPCRGRTPRRRHAGEPRAGQPGLARGLRAPAGARDRRLLGGHRRRGLRPARHHDRDPAHRHRQACRRGPGRIPRVARHRAGCRHAAALGHGVACRRGCPSPAARQRPRRLAACAPVLGGRGLGSRGSPPKPSAPSPATDGEIVELAYETVDWKPAEGGRLSEALYEDYALQSIRIPGAHAASDAARAVGGDGLGRAAQADVPAAPSGPRPLGGPPVGRAAGERHLRGRGARLASRRRLDGGRHLRCRCRRPPDECRCRTPCASGAAGSWATAPAAARAARWPASSSTTGSRAGARRCGSPSPS